jgi:hypothetical protein
MAQQIGVGLAFLLAIGAEPIADAAGMDVVDDKEGDIDRRDAGRLAMDGSVSEIPAPTLCASSDRRVSIPALPVFENLGARR